MRAFLFLSFILAVFAEAEPLGSIRRVDGGEARFIIESQTDLWTSPYQEKSDPLRRYDVSFKAPLVRREDWKAGVTVDAEGLRIGRPDLSVGEDEVEIHTDLRSQAIGFAASREHESGSWLSMYSAFESASDEPYKTPRDRYVSSSLMYGFEPQGKWQWLAGANRSYNRGFMNGRVLPVAGVFYRPSPTIMVGLGFPFFVFEWKTEENTLFQFIGSPVGFKTSFVRDLGDDFWYEFRAALAVRSYSHTERVNDDKRIFFEEQYIDAGMGLHLDEKTHVSVVVGQSFHRRVYEGYQVFRPIGPRYKLDTDLFGILRVEFEL